MYINSLLNCESSHARKNTSGGLLIILFDKALMSYDVDNTLDDEYSRVYLATRPNVKYFELSFLQGYRMFFD